MVRRRVDYTKMHLISQAMYEKLKKCLDEDKPKLPPPGPGEFVSEFIDPIPGPSNITITRPGDFPEDFDDDPLQQQQMEQEFQPRPPQQDTSSFFETREDVLTGARIPPKRGTKTLDIRKIKKSKPTFSTPLRRIALNRRPLPRIAEETQYIDQPEHEISAGEIESTPRPILTSTPMPRHVQIPAQIHRPSEQQGIEGIQPLSGERVEERMQVEPPDVPPEEIHQIVPVVRDIRPTRRPVQIEEIGSEPYIFPDLPIQDLRPDLPPPRDLRFPIRITQHRIPRKIPALEYIPEERPVNLPPGERLTRSRFRQLPLTSCDSRRPIVRVRYDDGETVMSDIPTLNNFVCPHCGKIYTTKYSLQRHKWQQHFSQATPKRDKKPGEPKDPPPPPPPATEMITVPTIGKHVCEECGKTFASKFALRSHIYHKHTSEATPKREKTPRDPRDPPSPPSKVSSSTSPKFHSWVKPGKRSQDEAKLKQHQPRKYKTNRATTHKRFDSWNL